MAERRMFAKTIVLSDAFLDMPLSARCLYFTLGMFADDDGFVNSPKGIMRQAGCSEDDMKVLLAKKFLLAFESGVIVIKHWRINNYLRNDRYVPTKYINEKAMLSEDENNAYTLSKPVGIPSNGIPNTVYTGKDSLGKDRLDKDSIDSSSKRSRFVPPTLEDVKAYASEAKLNVDPEKFYRYFTTPNDKGETWVDSKGNKVKNWKQKMLTWDRADSTVNVSQERAKSRNTMLNYAEKGVSHPRLEDIEMGIDDL